MAIQVTHKIVLQISLDTAEKRKLFFLEDDQASEVTSVGYDQQASSNLNIATSGTESLGFGDLTDVRGIYLEVSQECNVRINGSPDNIPLKLPAGVTESPKAKLFLEADINAVVVENLSASAVLIGTYCVWGDPTP